MSHYKRRPPCNHECGFKIIFGSFLTFWGPSGLFFGVRLGSKTVLGSSYVVEQLSFLCFLPFWHLIFTWIWGHFDFLGPQWATFGVGVGINNGFKVSSCSWTTFIFYVSFNSDIWFWFNFGVILTFWGPNRLFLGSGKSSKLFWGLLM